MSDHGLLAGDRDGALVRLADHRPSAFLVESIELEIDLDEIVTGVRCRMRLHRNPRVDGNDDPLVLDGRGLTLSRVAVDGRELDSSEYRLDESSLTIAGLGSSAILDTDVEFSPRSNHSFVGLYETNGVLVTNCEPDGFRRITYCLDRPDVLSRYVVTLRGDRERYPVLLSNGNPAGAGLLADGRHWARWDDPFPKPCYLVGIVAGALERLDDHFVTRSGRLVTLGAYAETINIDKCHYPLRSLKRAMAWDEEIYGREYDLDVLNLVVVSTFGGAEETKGLNIYGPASALARPDTATDQDYLARGFVVAHEYFHNWTGNRVTIRDWFQLTLKEGLTVFRQWQFGAHIAAPDMMRIWEVRLLRSMQFAEDTGPLAHPPRPDCYREVPNLYTATVYRKGAQIMRMLHTLLGPEAFRRGMDLFFDRYDGCAATVEDFLGAIAEGADRDLSQFSTWFTRAGTPLVRVERSYDAAARTFTLVLHQACEATHGQPDTAPRHMPVALGLLRQDGGEMRAQLDGEADSAPQGTRVLELRESRQTFRFINVDAAPVPSLFRAFSAPIRLDAGYTDAELALLMTSDTDLFNRWDAAQTYETRVILRLADTARTGVPIAADSGLTAAFARVLDQPDVDPNVAAEILTLPGETVLEEAVTTIDIEALHVARTSLRRHLAEALRDQLFATWNELHDRGPYQTDIASIGRRSLANVCLGYLMELDDPEIRHICLRQVQEGLNMTDVLAALAALANTACAERGVGLAHFYDTWRHDPEVLDKWFEVQALSRLPDALAQVVALTRHPDFSYSNPSRLRATIGGFAADNRINFHAVDGSGYRFVASQVLAIDAQTAITASGPGLAKVFDEFARWRRFDPARQALMQVELLRIADTPGISGPLRDRIAGLLGPA